MSSKASFESVMVL